jgi:hypothetical protein
MSGIALGFILLFCITMPASKPKNVSLKELSTSELNTMVPLTVSPYSLPPPPYPQIGAALLLQLERGNGPSIEIAWPRSSVERDHLFAALHDCYGVRVARMSGGRLVAVEGTLRKQAVSGFVRAVTGEISAYERRLLAALKVGGQTVRLFPRSLDTALLAGLVAKLGSSYASTRSIRARYRLMEDGLWLENLSTDSRLVAGSVQVIAAGSCAQSAI